MLHVASVCKTFCILLRVVGSSCAKFESGGQTFSYVQTDGTTPNTVWPTMLGADEVIFHRFGYLEEQYGSLDDVKVNVLIDGVVISVF